MKSVFETLRIMACFGALIGVSYLSHLLNPTPQRVVLPSPSTLDSLHKAFPEPFPGAFPGFNAQRRLLEEYQGRQSSPTSSTGTQPFNPCSLEDYLRRQSSHAVIPGTQPEVARSGEAGSKEAHP